MWVSDVNRPDKLFAVHQFDQPFDLIIDVTETSGLRTISVDSDGFLSDGFENEVADDSAIELIQSRTVSIENSCNSDVDSFDSIVFDEKSFRGSFTFVVA